MSTYASVLPSPQEKMREGPRDTEKVRHERETETGLEKDGARSSSMRTASAFGRISLSRAGLYLSPSEPSRGPRKDLNFLMNVMPQGKGLCEDCRLPSF